MEVLAKHLIKACAIITAYGVIRALVLISISGSAALRLSGFISTLVPVLLVAGGMFLVFLILRRSQRRQYAPRTYLGNLRER